MTTQPTFAHPVFERLYERDYFVDDAVLREILALGPATAVPELLKIISTSLEDYQAGKLADTDWLDAYYFQHAFYLLHELQAPEAFDEYRRVLRLNSESTEFWFGDDLFEDVPNLLAHAAQTRLPELLALLEDKEVILQHRLVVSSAITRLAKEQPELRPAISAFLQRYLRHIITHADQAKQLFPADTGMYNYELEDYLGLLLADVQDAGLRELEPEMRGLHRLGFVDESISGGENDMDFNQVSPLRPSPDIFTRYHELRDDPDSYSPFHPDAAGIARRRAQQEAKYAQARRDMARPQPQPVPAKIGRNDPCPCGSGKKYKKCHG
ncbi:SEC-C metal-binding domain-containing protein [Hymenobacter sp. H14-R3]|uniref:SEC-C metal-binding domain-containing protein n=1 Tax=Hymenobacter sp. H14-R3 TaxID=3046308 RepID=UPI0024BA7C37|nr:SEC-C metal-binding domain-containing protein [Hymenobacter sp. H14-R3]MDJ0365221.1 SEC-C metal-binding domain-containing protein [Hymenobacter sp. H14-R3]